MKTLENLIDDISPQYNDIDYDYIDAIHALEDGAFLSSYDVTEDQINDLYDNPWTSLPQVTLESDLEAVNMGINQIELAEFVQNHQRWKDYVKVQNFGGIPADPDNPNQPHPSYLDYVSATFTPDDLLKEACQALGWDNVPQNGGFLTNYNKKQKLALEV